jgi:transposase
MSYASDLTDDQWDLLEPVSKRAEQARPQARPRPAERGGRCEVVREHRHLGDGRLQVARIATTLRHLSREGARRRPVALAARPLAVANHAE